MIPRQNNNLVSGIPRIPMQSQKSRSKISRILRWNKNLGSKIQTPPKLASFLGMWRLSPSVNNFLPKFEASEDVVFLLSPKLANARWPHQTTLKTRNVLWKHHFYIKSQIASTAAWALPLIILDTRYIPNLVGMLEARICIHIRATIRVGFVVLSGTWNYI